MATRFNEIPELTAEQLRIESRAFRRIAALLGKDGWDDPCALIEVASDIVNDAHFPHPGTSDHDELYLDFSNALYDAERPSHE